MQKYASNFGITHIECKKKTWLVFFWINRLFSQDIPYPIPCPAMFPFLFYYYIITLFLSGLLYNATTWNKGIGLSSKTFSLLLVLENLLSNIYLMVWNTMMDKIRYVLGENFVIFISFNFLMDN